MRMIVATAFAGLLLSGCGAKVAESDPLTSGLHAFRAGDKATLSDALATLEAEPAEAPKPCSAEAYAADRRQVVAVVLTQLNSDTLFSISEEARFIYAIGFGLDRRPSTTDAPSRTCGQSASYPVQAQDIAERLRIMKSYNDGLKAWKQDLTARYGDELPQRLSGAAKVLKVNHIQPKGWSADQARANFGTEIF